MAETGIVTRFAPSPTGFLHIGNARTGLFNWLFARGHGGKFLLRIEDTDRVRSTEAATQAVFDALDWLGIDWDGDWVSQFECKDRHAEVAHALLDRGAAYRCYATREEIEAHRAQHPNEPFQSPWRDRTDPQDAPFSIRIKAPRGGETIIEDAVQGRVAFRNDTLDDMILLRSDGTPVYMLAVVVDDHDMGVTHIIRGDDHLHNAARQKMVYDAMGWNVPIFAHVPLIHGPSGGKLSKRDGAVGVSDFRAMGFPPEAVVNYLARLGWSHGDEEFFTAAQAMEWFSLDGIGKGPSRFDLKKLEHLSGLHLRALDPTELMDRLKDFAAAQRDQTLDPSRDGLLLTAMPTLVQRAKTYGEILDGAAFIYTERPIAMEPGAEEKLFSVSRGMLKELTERLQHDSWTHDELDASVRQFAAERGVKLGEVLQPARSALTGRVQSPSVIDVMLVLGKDESLARLSDAAA